MVTATGATGGTATFKEFTSISFAEFESGDLANVAGDIVSTNGPFIGLSETGSFIVVGEGDAPSVNDAGFQITQVVAEFTVVGVPEPSSFAALSLIGGAAVIRRRRCK